MNKLVPLIALFVISTTTCGTSPAALACFYDFEKVKGIIVSALSLVGLYFVFFTFLKPKHRGITHSLVLCLAFSVLIFLLLGTNFAISGFVGYLSHLLVDREVKAA